MRIQTTLNAELYQLILKLMKKLGLKNINEFVRYVLTEFIKNNQ
jgi:hypothetical protein